MENQNHTSIYKDIYKKILKDDISIKKILSEKLFQITLGFFNEFDLNANADSIEKIHSRLYDEFFESLRIDIKRETYNKDNVNEKIISNFKETIAKASPNITELYDGIRDRDSLIENWFCYSYFSSAIDLFQRLGIVDNKEINKKSVEQNYKIIFIDTLLSIQIEIKKNRVEQSDFKNKFDSLFKDKSIIHFIQDENISQFLKKEIEPLMIYWYEKIGFREKIKEEEKKIIFNNIWNYLKEKYKK